MAECERKANSLNAKTGGLDSLVRSCPQYEGLFLMKCASPDCASVALAPAVVSSHQRLGMQSIPLTVVLRCRETQAAFELWSELKSNVSTPSSFVNKAQKRQKVVGADDDAAASSSGDCAPPAPAAEAGDSCSHVPAAAHAPAAHAQPLALATHPQATQAGAAHSAG